MISIDLKCFDVPPSITRIIPNLAPSNERLLLQPTCCESEHPESVPDFVWIDEGVLLG